MIKKSILSFVIAFFTQSFAFSSQSNVSYSFPKDHYAHPKFQTEWWYFSGHFQNSSFNQSYGFELVFFSVRFQNQSTHTKFVNWKPTPVYFSHFALSDKIKKKFYYNEKINRPIGNIAGDKTNSFHLWNENWSALMVENSFHLKSNLVFENQSFQFNIKLYPLKPPVIHGLNGLSFKGYENNNYSHYYSISRLKLNGFIVVNGQKYNVQGSAWMDHEWMNNRRFYQNNNMPKWDWFSLQLDNNIEIMFYLIRSQNNQKPLSISSGTIIDSNGKKSRHLFLHDVSIKPLKFWKSQKTNSLYPIKWKFEIFEKNKKISELLVVPFFNQQELNTTKSSQIIYWEGAVKVRGYFKKFNVSGQGYVEMTGYDQ